ncbi:heme lyase CcmF/NrfE family subunit [Vibrio sp. S11_S32]|uniref:heme lyase CcmF/NrfE family subunit n=1 Tax=Vibrio sp. S11_S32 TaxID=2720225 RepID=UPI0016807E60|nr:heme lyase CcmF/NrfE family subunit [Vibrio sp. S11_S32]MBD1575673.1 heme lyase CcmF/NrfE family subunit [Vibrio sp. S11_S32]
MLPEVGHFILILAVMCAVLTACLASLCLYKTSIMDPKFIQANHVGLSDTNHRADFYAKAARELSYATFILVAISTVILAVCFAQDDFSVQYVDLHSNTHLPIFYKVAAVWGGHEGSFLFWLLSLTGWSALAAYVGRKRDQQFMTIVILVLALIAIAIGGYIIFASNPFLRAFPVPFEGRDLNPMLQDIGLIIHPPMLYLGYVGFSVSFAFAIATLISPKIELDWAKWMRPWAVASWVFLTGGIVLGASWAYYELGWGGWWFWDPVENASLMPWLTGTALLHSLSISQHKKQLVGWSLLLAIFSFSLSLLGTFIVRSGVLTSVHAFAADPTRGVVLLVILSLVLISSLSLFAWRANRYIQPVQFSWLSRSMAYFMTNGLLVLATFSVLLGTLYPMIFQIFDLGNISVGAPYFNSIFVPIVFVMCIVMGIMPALKWHKTNMKALLENTRMGFLLAIVIGGAASYGLYRPEYQWYEQSYALVVLSLILSCWVIVSALQAWFKSSGARLKQLAMVLAHCGVAVTIIGATLVSYCAVETNQKLAPGSQVTLNGHQLEYQKTKLVLGPNYTAEKGVVALYDPQGQYITTIYPERRHYTVRTMNMTEPGVYNTALGDWYITMGDKIDKTHYAVRIQYKPFVGWLWLGGLLMVLGGGLSVTRYMLQKPRCLLESHYA